MNRRGGFPEERNKVDCDMEGQMLQPGVTVHQRPTAVLVAKLM